MAGWRKHFQTYNNINGTQSPLSGNRNRDKNSTNRFQSWLPEVYVGQPNRLERYVQYDLMDMDSEINTALDTIAEFSTQQDDATETPFEIKWHDSPTETESEVLQTVLKQWVRVNEWNRRLFNTFRNTIKYGDQPFVRDPETWKLFYVNPSDVMRVIVDEAHGKEPAQYVIKNLDPNFQMLTATASHGAGNYAGGSVNPQNMLNSTQNRNSGQTSSTSSGMGGQMESVIDAKHVIHIALTDGMDMSWPFGNSVLDAVFKTFKQKELLEDSIIIYRVQRAPERRIFYIDVGDMPAHQAMSHVERVKNEIHQRRIPSKTGGGSNMMDAQYNPLCLSLDTTVPLLDGRILSITDLIAEYKAGKENWTYSCDPITGKIVPGNITWAGVTRKNTQVIKLTLNDGSTLTVTPDHKIPVLGKGFVEAQYLTPNDSLISYKTRKQGLTSSSHDRTYTQVYDHESNSWEYTHRMVGNFFREKKKHQEFTYSLDNVGSHKTIVHHKDFDRYNNDPRNLQWMNKADHIQYHSEQNMWNHLTEEESTRIKSKISNTVKTLWANGAYDVNNIKNAQKKFIHLSKNDASFKAAYSVSLSKSRKAFLSKNPEFVNDVLLPNLSKWSENIPNQTKVYTFDQLQAIYDLAVKYDFKMKYMLKATNDHAPVLNAIKETNVALTGKHFKINIDNLTQQVIYNTIHHYGYKNWMDFKRKKEEFNHRLVSIEWVNELQDTGTITIDGNERWHNHHTFPVNNSIFVKNSIMEDYFFAQCLSLDTKIELLDGRAISLQQIINEYEQGIENYAYGLSNKTFELEPAKITWAGVTRKNAKVLKVILDNGETVTATPDHKFILRDGSEVETQELMIGDSLMPLELHEGYSGPKQKNKKYRRYRSNLDGKMKFVHATISGKIPGKDTQVHHIDFNSKNNIPNNLEIMKTEDHIQLHKDAGTYSLNKQWNSPEGRQKLIAGIRGIYENRTEEFDVQLSKRNKKNALAFWNNKYKNTQQMSSMNSLRKAQKRVSDARRITFDITMTNAMIKSFNNGNNSISKLRKNLPDDIDFINAYKNANKDRLVSKSESDMISVTDSTLNKLANTIGYRTFGDWKTEYTGINKFSGKEIERQNHKIVDIIEIQERMDTGDITVESDSDSHWFGLSSGIYVHNSADGRGSKVDTLPGGDNLGDIDDLKFFNNKLARGLRIPSSYLPTGPDDGTATFNDGRVGTAFIQEYRFTQYCKRIQRIIQPALDKEFKMFLKHRGYEIDSSQFALDFVEPQSFSDYREIEINSARASVFGQVEGVEYISKRFALKKYLQLSEDEILENEKLWKQENPIKGNEGDAVDDDEFSDLGNVGVQGGADGSLDDFEADDIGDEEFDDIDLGDDGESAISGGGADGEEI